MATGLGLDQAIDDNRIAEVTPDRYPDVVALAVRTGMTASEHASLMSGFLQRDEFHAFAAWDGVEMVALSVLRFLGRQYADLVGTATLPSDRRRGAQAALIAARAALAARPRCTRVARGNQRATQPLTPHHGQSGSVEG